MSGTQTTVYIARANDFIVGVFATEEKASAALYMEKERDLKMFPERVAANIFYSVDEYPLDQRSKL